MQYDNITAFIICFCFQTVLTDLIRSALLSTFQSYVEAWLERWQGVAQANLKI